MNEANHTLGIGTNVWNKHKDVNNNAFLYWTVTKHGVPQGSIQSFLIFLPTWVIAKKLFMENINKCYLQMILINIYQF